MRRVGLILVLVAVATAAAAATDEPPLTPDGWGGLRVGMDEKAAIRRFGLRVVDSIEADCHVLAVPRHRGVKVMALGGRIDSVVVSGRSRIRTNRGLGVGSRESEVIGAYGRGLRIEPNHYLDPPAHYLTWRPDPQGRGVMYETDETGRVAIIHAGGDSIAYTDG